ncbi:MAG TPA: gas vesicle protein GvpJ [Dehalococcoidia bacterium]|nr:gas vesicle protein GvpJ [Dehalococcoidia bacterium]
MTARAVSGTASLVDAVDLLLNRGALLSGDATLSLAGVDLVYVGLNLLITSVETMQQHGLAPGPGAPARLQAAAAPPLAGRMPGAAVPHPTTVDPLAGQTAGTEPHSPTRAAALERLVEQAGAGGERPEQGLARLVLALVELLRQLLERQAVRRMESGTLAEADVERMGLALRELEQTMTVLRESFGLSAEDLDLDLGPLGRLLGDAP